MLKIISKYPIFRLSQKKKIPFNFKIPKNTDMQSSQWESSQKLPQQNAKKMIKIKKQNMRSQKLKKIQEKRQQFESLTTSQKNYYQTRHNNMKKNIKDQNFYESQYKRGQDLIDNIPIDPYYSYKVADYMKIVQQKKKNIQQLKYPDYSSDSRKINKYQKLIEVYNQKHEQYEIQLFQKYLRQYPGSHKGPLPQDDLQSYFAYAQKKMTPFVIEYLDRLTNRQKKQRKSYFKSNIHDISQKKANKQYGKSNIQTTSLLDVMQKSRNFEIPTQENFDDIKKEFLQNIGQQPCIQDNTFTQIPVIPSIPFVQYHSWMRNVILWAQFKQYYDLEQTKLAIQKYSKITQQLIQQKHENSETEGWEEIKPKAASLYPYFRTLPKSIRQNNAVKTIYLGLEFTQPDCTYKEKQEALNEAAYMTLPLDRISQFMMKTYIQNMKYYASKDEVDFVLSLSAQKTYDRKLFENLNRQQKLKKLLSGVKETKYPQPPPFHKFTDHDLAQLPIDYYDNDDGFWDQIIQQKLQRYQRAQPMLKQRKKLKH